MQYFVFFLLRQVLVHMCTHTHPSKLWRLWFHNFPLQMWVMSPSWSAMYYNTNYKVAACVVVVKDVSTKQAVRGIHIVVLSCKAQFLWVWEHVPLHWSKVPLYPSTAMWTMKSTSHSSFWPVGDSSLNLHLTSIRVFQKVKAAEPFVLQGKALILQWWLFLTLVRRFSTEIWVNSSNWKFSDCLFGALMLLLWCL